MGESHYNKVIEYIDNECVWVKFIFIPYYTLT